MMIGVLGCGNMADAIVRGIHQFDKSISFLTYTPSKTRAQTLAAAVGGRAVDDISEMVDCEILLIGCKPQQFAQLADEIKKKISRQNVHIVSMMAAIRLETIAHKLGQKNITRIMPNTPIFVGKGVTLMTHSDHLEIRQRQKIENLFSKLGSLHLMNSENELDQVMTVTGSGPAYAFLFTKTLVDKLVDWGIDPQSAKEMTIQMMEGSVEMMKRSEKDLTTLISDVTSKGGTTIEAIKVYEGNKLGLISAEALEASLRRARELSEELSK
jgi:pyrroline-5-carboxylate reductase